MPCPAPMRDPVRVAAAVFTRLMRAHDALPVPETYAGSYTPTRFVARTEQGEKEIGRRSLTGAGVVLEVDRSLLA